MNAPSSSGGIEAVLAALGESAKKAADGWTACCPGHNDRKASLSVKVCDDGKVLLKCHAGCTLATIVTALGLTVADLFPSDGPASHKSTAPAGRSKIIATYPYHDEHRTLLYEAVRYEPKDFRQRRPGADGGYIWNLDGVRLVPYRLPDLVAAVTAGQTVYIAEGEKDVETLRSWGLAATCNPMGAGKWSKVADVASEVLRGAGVVILPDDDEPGRKHAEDIAAHLDGVAASVKVLAHFTGAKDVTCWKETGGTREKLEEMVAAAPAWPGPTAAAEQGVVPYIGVRMSDVKRETVTWLWRHRIPFGKITILDGNPGDGKTLIGCEITGRVTRGQALPDDDVPRAPVGAVLVTLEDGLGDTIRGRLEAAGADLTRIIAIQTVPDKKGGERTFTLPDDVAVLEAAVAAVGAKFVFLDPLMAMLGDNVNSYKDQDVRRAFQPLARFAERTGVAVVINRHLNKITGGNPLYRGGGSIGIIGTARCGFMVLPDPSEDGVLVLAPTKANLGPKASALRYSIVPSVEYPDSASIVWKGESSFSSQELLSAHDDPKPRDEQPLEFLREILKDGTLAAEEVYGRGGESGYGKKVLQRASKFLGIVPKKDGFQGPWMWALPSQKRRGT